MPHSIPDSRLQQLPPQPGVYQFFDSQDRLLYIGKATSLRSRVRSYFRSSSDLSPAKQIMVAKIARIETTIVDTPSEALLLESTLIKRHQPPYNILMKDDKNFQYIHISADVFPAITTTRHLPSPATRQGSYFGPYTSGRDVQQTLKLLQSIFHYCPTPPTTKRGVVQYPSRPCLQYHLGRCVGPCARAIDAVEYGRIITHIKQFLKGDYQAIHTQLQARMVQAAADKQFEVAARARDQLQAIERMLAKQHVLFAQGDDGDYLSLVRDRRQAAVNVFVVRQGKLLQQYVLPLRHTADQSDEDIIAAVVDQYQAGLVTKARHIYTNVEVRRGRHRKLLQMGEQNAADFLRREALAQASAERTAQVALKELAAAIGQPSNPLQRVEIYDISHFQGAYTVASMVVFENGLPASNQYRKFKIKTVAGIDDFASMKEVLRRRLMRLPEKIKNFTEKSAWPVPNLIIIDGGKGQLSAAVSVLDMLKLDLPIISLAKREEEIFLPGNSIPIMLPRESEGLYLIQRMRDEAHRFAIGFYRSRHL